MFSLEVDVGSCGSVPTSHPSSPSTSSMGSMDSLAPSPSCPHSSSSMGSVVGVVMTSSSFELSSSIGSMVTRGPCGVPSVAILTNTPTPACCGPAYVVIMLSNCSVGSTGEAGSCGIASVMVLVGLSVSTSASSICSMVLA